MAYANSTGQFGIPYISSGERVSGASERDSALIIENLLRSAILGLGEAVVFSEGTYSYTVNADTTVTVTLTSVIGRHNYYLLDGSATWDSLPTGSVYYLYVQANSNTPKTLSDFNTTYSTSVVSSDLLLATVDLTGALPVIDTAPAGKLTESDIMTLLSTNTDPFGTILNQTTLNILSSLSVSLATGQSVTVSQTSASSTGNPLRVYQANSSYSAIQAYAGELSFGDTRTVTEGINLTDASNTAFNTTNKTIVGSVNENASGISTNTTNIGTNTTNISTNTTNIGTNTTNIGTNTTDIAYLKPVATAIADANPLASAAAPLLTHTLTANRTLDPFTGGIDGQEVTLRLTQDGASSYTFALSGSFNLGDEAAPATLALGSTAYLTFRLNGATWDYLGIKTGY